MNHALLMRVLHRRHNLLGVGDDIVNRQRPLSDVIGQRRPFDQGQHQRPVPPRLRNAINLTDVGMVKRSQQFRLPLESRQPVRVRSEDGRQHLQGDVSL